MQVHINTLIIVDNTLVLLCSILITLFPCIGGIDSCKGTAEMAFHSTSLVNIGIHVQWTMESVKPTTVSDRQAL